MSLRIQSAMNWAVTLYVKIQSNDGKTLVSRVDLPAGPAQTLLVPLQPFTPLSLGLKAGPQMPMTFEGQRVLLASSAGELERSQVVSVTLSMDQPKVAQSILLERFGVQDGDAVTQAAFGGLVDAYGQSTRAKWPEKVSSDEQLKKRRRQGTAATENLAGRAREVVPGQVRWLEQRPGIQGQRLFPHGEARRSLVPGDAGRPSVLFARGQHCHPGRRPDLRRRP